ncbi:hypothetical protein LDL77_01970 [Flagellimonas marinaquae]|nr:hypothetical protein LDL77_01970 [Allomuricauda aquimarina]
MFDETSFGQNGSRPNGSLVRPSFANPSWGFACKAANPSVRPTNFKGSVIKEALIVFRGIEKQGRAQGLPIRTPLPALA